MDDLSLGASVPQSLYKLSISLEQDRSEEMKNDPLLSTWIDVSEIENRSDAVSRIRSEAK